MSTGYDIEGYEHRALLGDPQLLHEYSPCKIFMEFHVTLLKAAKAAPLTETLQHGISEWKSEHYVQALDVVSE